MGALVCDICELRPEARWRRVEGGWVIEPNKMGPDGICRSCWRDHDEMLNDSEGC